MNGDGTPVGAGLPCPPPIYRPPAHPPHTWNNLLKLITGPPLDDHAWIDLVVSESYPLPRYNGHGCIRLVVTFPGADKSALGTVNRPLQASRPLLRYPGYSVSAPMRPDHHRLNRTLIGILLSVIADNRQLEVLALEGHNHQHNPANE